MDGVVSMIISYYIVQFEREFQGCELVASGKFNAPVSIAIMAIVSAQHIVTLLISTQTKLGTKENNHSKMCTIPFHIQCKTYCSVFKFIWPLIKWLFGK